MSPLPEPRRPLCRQTYAIIIAHSPTRSAGFNDYDQDALRAKVADVYVRWYARRQGSRPEFDKTFASRAVLALAGIAALISLVAHIQPHVEPVALTAFELDVSSAMALLLWASRRAGPGLMDRTMTSLRSIWQTGQWLPARNAPEHRDGMVLLVDVLVKARTTSPPQQVAASLRAELARQIMSAARLIREDREFRGVKIPRSLLALRRHQLAVLANSIESQAGTVFAVDGARSLENTCETLVGLLRAWAHDEVQDYIAKLPEPTRQAVWRGRIRAIIGPAVLFAIGLAFVLKGGSLASGGGAATMLAAVLTVTGAPAPLDSAKMLVGR